MFQYPVYCNPQGIANSHAIYKGATLHHIHTALISEAFPCKCRQINVSSIHGVRNDFQQSNFHPLLMTFVNFHSNVLYSYRPAVTEN